MSLRAYATLAALKTRQQSRNTTADDQMLLKLRTATEAIEDRTHRVFQPLMEARRFDYHSSGKVHLRAQDLLSISSITCNDGSTISPNAIVAFDRGYVELDEALGYFTYVSTKRNAITVTGIWGYHHDYASAGWHSSSLTVADASGITDSVTTVTTALNTGTDAWSKTPIFSPGQLIRVGSEFMHVIAVPSTTTITVIRAANGSTAAAHVLGAAIDTYEAPTNIMEITCRWAALLMAQDNTDFGKKTITAFGIDVPIGMPADMVERLITYRNDRVA